MNLIGVMRALVIADHWELTSSLTPAACSDRLCASVGPWRRWSILPIPHHQPDDCGDVKDGRFRLRQEGRRWWYPTARGRIVAQGSSTRIDLRARTTAPAMLFVSLFVVLPLLAPLTALAAWSAGQEGIGPTKVAFAGLVAVWFQVFTWGGLVPDIVAVKWSYAGLVRDCLEATIVAGPPGADPDAEAWWRRIFGW